MALGPPLPSLNFLNSCWHHFLPSNFPLSCTLFCLLLYIHILSRNMMPLEVGSDGGGTYVQSGLAAMLVHSKYLPVFGWPVCSSIKDICSDISCNLGSAEALVTSGRSFIRVRHCLILALFTNQTNTHWMLLCVRHWERPRESEVKKKK